MSKKFWYTARVKNSSGTHAVFYASTRPRVGSTCEGVAKPNRVVGFKRELMPAKNEIMKFASERQAREREGNTKTTIRTVRARAPRYTCQINYATWWCLTHNCGLTEAGRCPKQ